MDDSLGGDVEKFMGVGIDDLGLLVVLLEKGQLLVGGITGEEEIDVLGVDGDVLPLVGVDDGGGGLETERVTDTEHGSADRFIGTGAGQDQVVVLLGEGSDPVDVLGEGGVEGAKFGGGHGIAGLFEADAVPEDGVAEVEAGTGELGGGGAELLADEADEVVVHGHRDMGVDAVVEEKVGVVVGGGRAGGAGYFEVGVVGDTEEEGEFLEAAFGTLLVLEEREKDRVVDTEGAGTQGGGVGGVGGHQVEEIELDVLADDEGVGAGEETEPLGDTLSVVRGGVDVGAEIGGAEGDGNDLVLEGDAVYVEGFERVEDGLVLASEDAVGLDVEGDEGFRAPREGDGGEGGGNGEIVERGNAGLVGELACPHIVGEDREVGGHRVDQGGLSAGHQHGRVVGAEHTDGDGRELVRTKEFGGVGGQEQ